jgi:hypothetical protein
MWGMRNESVLYHHFVSSSRLTYAPSICREGDLEIESRFRQYSESGPRRDGDKLPLHVDVSDSVHTITIEAARWTLP